MSEIHFWHIDNMLRVVEALAKEKYDFKITTSPNGTWNIEIQEDSINHRMPE
jgi:N-acetyl-beta-hexosaminidase